MEQNAAWMRLIQLGLFGLLLLVRAVTTVLLRSRTIQSSRRCAGSIFDARPILGWLLGFFSIS